MIDAAPAVNLDQARRFLEALAGSPDAVVTWQSFDDDSTRKDPALAVVMHGTLAGCADELVALNARGAGIFLTVNATDGHGRKAENVTDLRALFVDKDTGPLGPLALEPAIRVRTVQGEHAYWLLKPGEFRDEFRNAQKRLIRALDTDPSIIDLSRVMRVPGFLHCKGSPAQITCEIGDLTKRSIPDVLKAFPLLRAVKENDSAPRRSKRDRFDEAVAKLATARENRNDTLFRTARIGRDLVRQGTLTEDEVEDACLDACLRNGLTSEEDAKTLNTLTRALTDDGSWEARLQVNDKGIPAANLGNAIMILSNHAAWAGVVAFNVRDLKVYFLSAPPFMAEYAGGQDSYPRVMTPADAGRTAAWFTAFQKMGLSGAAAFEALEIVSHQTEFDPVLQYLEALPPWDRVPRLSTWLTRYAGVDDTPYSRAVGMRWLISAVARACWPGCQADAMLILEGKQGKRKSSLVRALAGSWFGDQLPNLERKETDAKQYMHGPWIIEVQELDAFSRSENSTIKKFLTIRDDTFRAPYARGHERHLRRGVCAGSTNDDDRYLRDPSGARRFWPVYCREAIDVEGLQRDRDQLFAEALDAYDRGIQWHLTDEEVALARVEQEARFDVDELENDLAVLLEKGRAGSPAFSGVAARAAIPPKCTLVGIGEILHALQLQTSRAEQMRVARVLRRLGFDRVRVTEGDLRIWKYSKVAP